MKLVSVEIARTLIGSLALVIVAPLTAYICGWMYCQDKHRLGRATANPNKSQQLS